MLIGELVKRSGLTKDAIRFYERKGLIKLDKKQRRANNYKEYPEQVLERLMLIKSIKAFGFTIRETDMLLNRWKDENNVCSMVNTVDDKVAQLDKQIRCLTELREKLTSSAINCRAGNCEFNRPFLSP